MKIRYAVILSVVLLLVSACAQKVNDPADVQAIKQVVADYTKATNAGDAGAIAELTTDKTIFAYPNSSALVGKEAIRSIHQAFAKEGSAEFSAPVEEVRVTGDLAIARGTWTEKVTPRAEDIASASYSGSWIASFARQTDGSWKWDWLVPNSNQPLPGSTADGAEEKVLIQIERDWAKALEKSDAAGFEKYLAKEWTYTADGQVMSRAQMLAEMRGGAYKIESAQMTELKPHVFGDVAVVTMTAIMKGKYKGADFPSPVRSTDFFVKRDGRWQAVSTQNITIQ